MRRLLILLFLFLVPAWCSARLTGKNLVDSLLKELPKFKGDTNRVKLLDGIAGAFGELYPDESIKYEIEELELATKLGWNYGIGAAYAHLGDDYVANKNVPLGKSYMVRALGIFQQMNNKLYVAHEQKAIAEEYESEKNYDSALFYYRERQIICDSIGNSEKIVENLLQIAYLLKLKGDYGGALIVSYKAIKDAEHLEKDFSKPFTAAVEGVMGEAYLGLAKDGRGTKLHVSGREIDKKTALDSAVKLLENAINGNEEASQLENLIEFTKALSEAYVLSGNYKKALEITQFAQTITDSVKKGYARDDNEIREMVNAQNKAQINLEEKQIATEKKARLFFIGGIGLLIVLVAFILKNARNQKKANKQIAKEKEEIGKLKNEIEERHNQTIESVSYAKRIQAAVLPSAKEISQELPASFILFRPKDIVSGDFYWFSKMGTKLIIAAVDCTGHGVPGAFMSMIGNSLLNQIVNEQGSEEPAMILNRLNGAVIDSLKQSENESNDGMDVSICLFDLKNNELQFAGANRPLWIIRNDELQAFKPDKFPIGGLQMARDRTFTNHKIALRKNDTVYIFSDGYADQFGGDSGKKLMTSKFKEVLLSIQNLNMREQEKKLDDYFDKWKGGNEQVDDVLVIGVRV